MPPDTQSDPPTLLLFMPRLNDAHIQAARARHTYITSDTWLQALYCCCGAPQHPPLPQPDTCTHARTHKRTHTHTHTHARTHAHTHTHTWLQALFCCCGAPLHPPFLQPPAKLKPQRQHRQLPQPMSRNLQSCCKRPQPWGQPRTPCCSTAGAGSCRDGCQPQKQPR